MTHDPRRAFPGVAVCALCCRSLCCRRGAGAEGHACGDAAKPRGPDPQHLGGAGHLDGGDRLQHQPLFRGPGGGPGGHGSAGQCWKRQRDLCGRNGRLAGGALAGGAARRRDAGQNSGGERAAAGGLGRLALWLDHAGAAAGPDRPDPGGAVAQHARRGRRRQQRRQQLRQIQSCGDRRGPDQAQLHRRRRLRRGQAGFARSRGFPPPAREIPPPRCPHPPRRIARRSSRLRQDSSC
ncbi:hypothetical protein DEFR109230_19180 [Deinococcus frigens]